VCEVKRNRSLQVLKLLAECVGEAGKAPHVNVAAATAFIDWLVSEEGKSAIASHHIGGEQMFTPAPGPTN
jgi:ABC-type tungstate transport system permease subunit